MVLTLLITYFKGAPFYNAITTVRRKEHPDEARKKRRLDIGGISVVTRD